MIIRTSWLTRLLLCASLSIATTNLPALAASRAPAAPATATAADIDFLALRDASLRGEIAESGRLAARLGGYPMQAYVEYYRLLPRLISAPEGEIRSYLQRYDGSAIADRLRNDWLLILGRAQSWRVFDEQYPLFALNDDTQLKCYALASRVAKGENVAAQARELLVQPKYYGDACAELIVRLSQANQFGSADLWHQIRLATEYNQLGIVRRLANLTDATDKQLMQAIDKPDPVLERGIVAPQTSVELFIIALGRVARTDPEKAARALNKVIAVCQPKIRRRPGRRLLCRLRWRCLPMRLLTGARPGVRACRKMPCSGAHAPHCAQETGRWLPKRSKPCRVK